MEEPPTDYAMTNAGEDICESVAMFFVNKRHLQKIAPQRSRFIEKMVKEWVPFAAPHRHQDSRQDRIKLQQDASGCPVITLEQLLDLRGADLDVARRILGPHTDHREPVTEYQGLTDLDVIDAPDGSGIYLRGDVVVLIYVGADALPDNLNHQTLSGAAGSGGDLLRSRQGKRANLHVVPTRECLVGSRRSDRLRGIVPPTSLAAYRRDIYREPAKFVR